eukprot:8992285-Pyramimonas_sp.AAC.1
MQCHPCCTTDARSSLRGAIQIAQALRCNQCGAPHAKCNDSPDSEEAPREGGRTRHTAASFFDESNR